MANWARHLRRGCECADQAGARLLLAQSIDGITPGSPKLSAELQSGGDLRIVRRAASEA